MNSSKDIKTIELVDDKTKEAIGVTIQYLPCGHQNNLSIRDIENKSLRTKDVCPKGCVIK